MPVRFPTAIGQIELYGAADGIAPVDPNGRIGKIGTGSSVPGAELDDLDFLAGDGSKAAPEIAREPARLQLEFARHWQRGKQSAFMNARGGAKLGIAAGEGHGGGGGGGGG